MTKLTADYPCFYGGHLLVGTWLSLVEHSLGVRGVGSSNLPVPTISFLFHQSLNSRSRVEPTHEAPQYRAKPRERPHIFFTPFLTVQSENVSFIPNGFPP